MAEAKYPAFFPFNYQYVLQSAIYSLIRESSLDHATFLHGKGYVKEGINKLYKFFTFSKLDFTPKIREKNGFQNVRLIRFTFSTIMETNLKHLVLGIFSNRTITLILNKRTIILKILTVDVEKDPDFSTNERFTCLSPVAVSTMMENDKGRIVPHFLDYMNPTERDHFVDNLRKNLVNKYETLTDSPYENQGDYPFKFQFDLDYIAKKNGRISKLIEFKNKIKIKAMEAPFRVEADPELIRIGYECGWGEKNSAGFGCVKHLGT